MIIACCCINACKNAGPRALSGTQNAVDSLKSYKDVNAFLSKHLEDTTKYLSDNAVDSGRFSENRFFKLDFNRDGRTDLLINSQQGVIAVIDKGTHEYYTRFFYNRWDRENNVSDTASIGKNHLLILRSIDKWKELNGLDSIRVDTLWFASGDFIEYNPGSTNIQLQQIKFRTGPCFGSCPVFELTIDADRNMMYKAGDFEKKEGQFKGILDQETYNKLADLVGNIGLERLKDHYAVKVTDQPSVLLEIKYNNGKTKIITDYGEEGTYGLQALYHFLFRLRENQSWTKM
jgi:hypothetical protein